MSVTIHELLDDLRASALDERDKGDKFERLIQAYLRTDPEWTARFSEVWSWTDWPGRNGVTDIGIDLVAANRDRDDFTAIQCKFYESGRTVAKSAIDSFLAISMRPDFNFSQRIVFDTAARWGGNAEETMRGVAQRIDIGYLDDAAIDWSQYSWSTPQVLVTTGKKALRPHQVKARDDVLAGLAEHDRGKLIMACGGGKTFTSLKIAEELVGEGGSVLFLVPSIQLLSQSLREWMAETEVDIRPFAVCSDVRVGRRVNSDDADISVIDLTEPATTDAGTLIARMAVGRHATERMTVVFSTYQSIDVITQAQAQGLPEFDLVICDEAHRTTGVTLAADDESSFVKVHDNGHLKAKKRLYMTATPRVFGEEVRKKAADADAVLADMGDENIYGPELHRLGFGDAVEAGLLTDYKVLVLAVDEEYVAENFQNAMATSGEIALGDAAKLIGCWNGLAKNYGSATEETADPLPMRRAVAFAKDIKASKTAAASFPTLVDRALQDETSGKPVATALRVEAEHVDGTMGIHERNTHLAWLKAETPDDVCRVLSNARCLSEGVDVPALDAVMFLTPRGSQVDVVQSVGRVMRKAPGKELGYIILPIVVPSGVAPEEALKDNERYRVVWQVLQALRSHDDRFHAMINQIELNKRKTPQLVIDNVTPRPEAENPNQGTGDGAGGSQDGSGGSGSGTEQLALDYGFDGFRDAMYAKIVQKVGERRYWETWAKDVAEIAQAHITRIKGLLADPESNQAKEFEEFLRGLRGNLNESITSEEAIEMLAQHLVTKPIFDALFEGYDFTAHNPVAKTMELMLASLDEHTLDSENERLEKFYASVRRRVEGVNNAEGKQRIIVELYDRFFATAFKKTVDKLGIVYTPIEIVDFILNSADQVLREEFGQGLTDEGVHILDGFTGTGTFIVRLLQSGLIEPHDLARKYANELHANEILLLAYYIAAVNIETTYADLTADPQAFPGLILTDTFQSWEPDDRQDLEVFPENNARLEHLKRLPITVVVGNPPYRLGQDAVEDDNANETYPYLDQAIRDTYVVRSTAKLKSKMYDSYVRAIKWASLRIRDRGVVAFVTNGSFLSDKVFDGMRKSLVSEFTGVYVFNLRGNQRTAGEQSRKEGGKVFGSGSRAAVAVTVLVRNPDQQPPAKVKLGEVADYLSRDEKLRLLGSTGSILDAATVEVVPNQAGDWKDLRSEAFETFLALRDEGTAIFSDNALGVSTNRDSFLVGFGKEAVLRNASAFIEHFADRQDALASGEALDQVIRDSDPTRISWSDGLKREVQREHRTVVDPGCLRQITYRPFTRNWLYLEPRIVDRPGRTGSYFRTQGDLAIGIITSAARTPFAALMLDSQPSLSLFMDAAQCFGRWRYEPIDPEALAIEEELVDGYRRIDNISDAAFGRFASAYPDLGITKDDIFFYVYGLLHSPTYRTDFGADLKKMLPRIPLTRAFGEFVESGRRLADLHLSYESTNAFPLAGLDAEPSPGVSPWDFYSVGSKKVAFGPPTREGKESGERYDRSTIRFNQHITLSGVPDDAHRYMLGSRSAIEWIMDRYYVKTDKASGIVNDPNDWSREVGDPRYILDLLARIVTVSVETMKIVDALPPLDIIEDA